MEMCLQRLQKMHVNDLLLLPYKLQNCSQDTELLDVLPYMETGWILLEEYKMSTVNNQKKKRQKETKHQHQSPKLISHVSIDEIKSIMLKEIVGPGPQYTHKAPGPDGHTADFIRVHVILRVLMYLKLFLISFQLPKC